jgi:CheY-like chemotaxis protein
MNASKSMSGADDYVGKPIIDFEAFIEMVKRLLSAPAQANEPTAAP